MFVAVGANGIILNSPGGISWTNRTTDNRPLLDKVAYGNGVFVVVGQEIDTGGVGHGVVLTSLDGLNWTLTTKLGTDISLNCIAFGKGTFVTAGEAVVYHPGEPHVPMWASQDGVNWIPVHVPIDNDTITGVTYGNNLFVATTIMGGIMTSPDGAAWTVRKPSTGVSLTSTYVLNGVSYGNNTFVAIGGSSDTVNVAKPFNNGVVLTSSDGASWNSQSSGAQDLLVGISFGNNTFVAVGSGGIILTSQDGKTWTRQFSGIQGDLYQAAYGNNTFVIVGDKGTILQSDALPSAPEKQQLTETIIRFHIGSTDCYINNSAGKMDSAPLIEDGRTLLPIGNVAALLGASVGWNQQDQEATVTLGDKTLQLWIGNNISKANGVAIPIDPENPGIVPIIAPPGRTMLPLRFIAENFGCQVNWYPSQQEIVLIYPKE